ncbi:hypothetical protein ILYODFUR_030119 [Ilyodon furcidens]|uniref:Uncharacterized protein n=1 Tax=Ilyodon furcidens TaxID=33524 RepID=A0ABV0TRR2_9TELE
MMMVKMGEVKSENNKVPLQRSRSRQNVNVSSTAAKAPAAKEARNESEGHPSVARAKASACFEVGRKYKNTPGHSCGLDREQAAEKEMVKPAEKKPEIEAETSAIQPSSADANGEPDVEALLARLRAL